MAPIDAYEINSNPNTKTHSHIEEFRVTVLSSPHMKHTIVFQLERVNLRFPQVMKFGSFDEGLADVYVLSQENNRSFRLFIGLKTDGTDECLRLWNLKEFFLWNSFSRSIKEILIKNFKAHLISIYIWFLFLFFIKHFQIKKYL